MHFESCSILKRICGYRATSPSPFYKPERSSCVSDSYQRETSRVLNPRYDDRGLLSAVVVDSETKSVLMVAFMNAQALEATLESGEAHFYSRSRDALWKKGETSGNVLKVDDILVDCDQDAFVLHCSPAGPTCHTGARSCFYRVVEGRTLQPVNT